MIWRCLPLILGTLYNFGAAVTFTVIGEYTLAVWAFVAMSWAAYATVVTYLYHDTIRKGQDNGRGKTSPSQF